MRKITATIRLNVYEDMTADYEIINEHKIPYALLGTQLTRVIDYIEHQVGGMLRDSYTEPQNKEQFDAMVEDAAKKDGEVLKDIFRKLESHEERNKVIQETEE